MTTQLSLLDAQTIGAPHNGTETSIAAAVIAGPKQGRIKDHVLRTLAFVGDVTQDEMSQLLMRPRQSMTAAFNALAREGEIRKLDGVTRPSIYGGMCAVYVLAGVAEGLAAGPDEVTPAARQPSGLRANETEGGQRIGSKQEEAM